MKNTAPVRASVTYRPVVPVRWYEPWPGSAAAPGPTLLWLHGGGFFRGGLDQPEAHDVARSLAARGVRVATVDYRLAVGTRWHSTTCSPPTARSSTGRRRA